MDVLFKLYQCTATFGEYINGNIAIQLIGKQGTNFDGELIATATVNAHEVDHDVVGIKNWSENHGMSQALIAAGIIKDELLYSMPSGYVEVEYYELTEKALEEISRLKEELRGE